jgi:phenylalanyl-tRNA synthetase beta chain
VNTLIGTEIEKEMIKSILTDLEMTIEKETEEGLDLIVPAYRNDVTREADIIEDILRVYGYNNVDFGTKLNSSISFSEGFNVERTTEIIANQLASMGFNEMMANSLTTAKYADSVESLNNDHNVVILNPLSSDLGVMRQSLLFGGLESISHNINRKRNSLKLYEFGKSYHKFESGYNERKHLALFTTGNQNEEAWNGTSVPTDFFYIKAVAMNVLEKFGITGLKQKPSSSDIFQEGITLLKGKLKLAELGVVKKSVLKGNDIKQNVFYADLDWENIISLGAKTDVKFQELPKFPEVKRDLALLLDSDVKFADIYNAATQSERKLLKAVNLFDVYEGDKLPEGKKSYAVSFILQDNDKTLVDKVVDKIMSKLIKTFEKQFDAELRS